MLPTEEFADIVKKTPIVAVDIIVEKQDGRVLLGRRNNSPAKGFFFTFGGIVRKNETLSGAISRVSLNELNYKIEMSMLTFNNVFECVFEENFLGNEDFSSHYIVLSYYFKDRYGLINPPLAFENSGYSNQHSEYIYLTPEEILGDSSMHEYLKRIISHFCKKMCRLL